MPTKRRKKGKRKVKEVGKKESKMCKKLLSIFKFCVSYIMISFIQCCVILRGE